MLVNMQGIIGDLNSFLLCVLIGMVIILAISLILLPRLHIASILIGWYGIFIKYKKLTLVVVSILFVRLFYMISFIWSVKHLSLTNLWIYIILEIAAFALIRNVVYVLYDVGYSAGMLGLIYVLYLVKEELAKAQVTRGMNILHIMTMLIFVAAAIGQFFIGLYLMLGKQNKSQKNVINYKKASFLLIPILAIYCILPIYIITNIEYIKVDTKVYQMIQGEKKFFSENSRISLTEEGCLIESEKDSEILSGAPLYWEGKKKVLFTKTYSIVRPALELTNRINVMSMLEWEEGIFHVKESSKSVTVDNFFLFDGKDTYYFAKDVSLSWDNQTITLPSFSEVVVRYNQGVSVYDFEKDLYTEYNTGNSFCIATMNGREKINLSTDILYRDNGQEQMLFLQPALLQDLE